MGPGNRYVAEAKRQVSGVVGVASAFAGPSEVVVIAGPDTPPEFAAIDLVVQAEHGPDGLAWLVTWSEDVVDGGHRRRRPDRGRTRPGGPTSRRRSAPVARPSWSTDPSRPAPCPTWWPPSTSRSSPSRRDAVAAATSSRPAPSSSGTNAPASVGDYLAGPNHVLPTNRTARFASALRVDDFRKHIHAVRHGRRRRCETLGPHVVTLAETEGLPAHAESVRLRWPR